MPDLCSADDREDFIFREDLMHLFDAELTSGMKSSRSCRVPLSGIPPDGGHAGRDRASRARAAGSGRQGPGGRSRRAAALPGAPSRTQRGLRSPLAFSRSVQPRVLPQLGQPVTRAPPLQVVAVLVLAQVTDPDPPVRAHQAATCFPLTTKATPISARYRDMD